VGVFDDNGSGFHDDFVGRVVLDIARLRPQSTYDITLPLRKYRNNYARTRRGAIQLRIRLDWNSERDALLSYLRCPIPKKQNGRLVPTTTIACADFKGFRNVAVTCRGRILPGKYNKQMERGVKRELKLYKIIIKITIKKIVKDTVMYKHPPISLFVFTAWMNCVQTSSFYLVPPYTVLTMIFLLMYNYTQVVLNPEYHNGYQPLTIWEMLLALLLGSSGQKSYMKPLDNERALMVPKNFSGRTVATKETKESYSGHSSSNLDHMEFPFSDKDRYPKISVQNSLVKSKKLKLKIKKVVRKGKTVISGEASVYNELSEDDDVVDGSSDSDDENNSEVVTISKSAAKVKEKKIKKKKGIRRLLSKQKRDKHNDHTEAGVDDNIPGDDDSGGGGGNDSEDINISKPARKSGVESNHVESYEVKEGNPDEDDRNDIGVADDDKDENEQPSLNQKRILSHASQKQRVSIFAVESIEIAEQSLPEIGYELSDDDEDSLYDEVYKCDETRSQAYWKIVPGGRPLPEQDSTLAVKRSMPFSKELLRAKERLQNKTLRLFDDRIYFVSEDDIVNKTSMESVERHLDNELGIYNYPNPVMKKLAEYLSPILEIMTIGLNFCRVTFNMFMWRDPYLSFWVLLFFVFLFLILLVFPWQLFFFFCGIVLVGPQNWILFIKKGKIESKITETSEQSKNQPNRDNSSDIVFNEKSETSENDTKCSNCSPEIDKSNSSNIVTLEDEQNASKHDNEDTSINDEDDASVNDTSMKLQKNPKKTARQHCTRPRFIFEHHNNPTNHGGVKGELDLKNASKKNVASKKKKGQHKDQSAKEVRQVVVPYYSPLLDSRFYDWPPEHLQ